MVGTLRGSRAGKLAAVASQILLVLPPIRVSVTARRSLQPIDFSALARLGQVALSNNPITNLGLTHWDDGDDRFYPVLPGSTGDGTFIHGEPHTSIDLNLSPKKVQLSMFEGTAFDLTRFQ
jgi:hypothetical protein